MVILTVNTLCKAEIDDRGKFGHTLVHIYNISIVVRIDICYTYFCVVNRTVEPTLTGFQGLK